MSQTSIILSLWFCSNLLASSLEEIPVEDADEVGCMARCKRRFGFYQKSVAYLEDGNKLKAKCLTARQLDKILSYHHSINSVTISGIQPTRGVRATKERFEDVLIGHGIRDYTLCFKPILGLFPRSVVREKVPPPSRRFVSIAVAPAIYIRGYIKED